MLGRTGRPHSTIFIRQKKPARNPCSGAQVHRSTSLLLTTKDIIIFSTMCVSECCLWRNSREQNAIISRSASSTGAESCAFCSSQKIDHQNYSVSNKKAWKTVLLIVCWKPSAFRLFLLIMSGFTFVKKCEPLKMIWHGHGIINLIGNYFASL